MKKDDKTKQEGLILIEANMANTLLLVGLDSLRRASLFKVGSYYQAFFSLSIGIERILKLICIYDYRNKNNGRFPENKVLKDLGHDINKMIKIYKPELLQEHIYKIVIDFMTDFAQKTRYYNLNELTGKEDADPILVWGFIEPIILKHYNVEIPMIENKKKVMNDLNKLLDIHLKLSDGTTIYNAEPIILEYETNKIAREYNVLVLYKIIRALVNTLIKIQGNNEYPDMKEIFNTFVQNWEEVEIRNKEDWSLS